MWHEEPQNVTLETEHKTRKSPEEWDQGCKGPGSHGIEEAGGRRGNAQPVNGELSGGGAVDLG